MNQQDIEVTLKVLEERQRVQANHLKDVDECCGKLKGSTSQEFRIIGERIAAIENNIDDNCKDIKLEMSTTIVALEEREKAQCEQIKQINKELQSIHSAYRKVTLEFILALAVAVLGLILHL